MLGRKNSLTRSCDFVDVISNTVNPLYVPPGVLFISGPFKGEGEAHLITKRRLYSFSVKN